MGYCSNAIFTLKSILLQLSKVNIFSMSQKIDLKLTSQNRILFHEKLLS